MVEYIHLDQEEGGRRMGPVPIARRVYDAVMAKEDTKIISELASVTVSHNQFGGFQFKMGFHQNEVDEKFTFNPNIAQREPVGDTTSKASAIQDLDRELGLLATLIKEATGANPWEFASLDAASIGGTGALTDYEFEYQTGTTKDKHEEGKMEEVIEEFA